LAQGFSRHLLSIAMESDALLGYWQGASRRGDPLANRAKDKIAANEAKPRKDKKGHTAALAVALALLSTTFYVTMVFIATYGFHKVPRLVWLYFFFALGLALLWFWFAGRHWKRRREERQWLGQSSAAGTCCGMLFGLFVYFNWMIYFHAYRERRAYTNVAASQPGAQFQDAGSLRFTPETQVDTTKSVGYASATRGETLCVAPVVDSSLTQPDAAVSFFAYGVGCCAWRANFGCGDAGDPWAHGGLMMLGSYDIYSPWLAWLIESVGGGVDMTGFDDAISLQKAAFGTVASPAPRLVRWARDPSSLERTYAYHGLEAVLISCAVYMALACAGGCLVSCCASRIRPEKRLTT